MNKTDDLGRSSFEELMEWNSQPSTDRKLRGACLYSLEICLILATAKLKNPNELNKTLSQNKQTNNLKMRTGRVKWRKKYCGKMESLDLA